MRATDHEGLSGAVQVLAGTRATVALDADLAHTSRDDLLRALESAEPVVAFLSALTAHGVRDLPRFAYVGREQGGARLLLRGGIEAVERQRDGTEVVHSAGSVSTWTEVLRERCGDISLRLAGGPTIAVVVFEAPVATSARAVDEIHVEAAADDVRSPARAEALDIGAPPAPAADGVHPPAPSAPAVDETVLPEPDFELETPTPPAAEPISASAADPTLAHPIPTGRPDDVADPLVVSHVVGDRAGDDEVDLSHLFETRHVGVEAAAVRPDDPAPPSSGASPGVVAEAPPPTGLPARLPPPAGSPVGGALPSLPPPTGPAVALPPPPGLIAGVPGVSPDAPGAPASPGSVAAGPAGPPDVLVPGGDAADAAGDHDGMTISPAQLAALRAGAQGAAPSGAPAAVGPQLQAVTCPAGHLNPPQAERCRTCGGSIVDRAIRVVARPTLGHLSFDTGMVADIDRPMLIGRKPTVEGLAPGVEVPALIVLPDPDGSLSRVHVEVRLEGWEVLIVDRDSTNGTRVEIPGQPPQLLRPHEPILITPGTNIVLADVVTATFKTGPR